MSKILTVSEMADEIGVTFWTINRWYKWYENEDINKLNELYKKGMPELPKYQTMGPRKWKIWSEEDIAQMKKFKEFIPNTRGGFMGGVK